MIFQIFMTETFTITDKYAIIKIFRAIKPVNISLKKGNYKLWVKNQNILHIQQEILS